MDYPSTKEYLFSLKGKGSKYGIDRMRMLVEALGHPERGMRIIHVAGTNGKGSVSAMCEAVCRAAGYRTGLYTSPHLVRLGERIQVDRKILSEEEIIAYTLELKGAAEAIERESPEDHPTFFEFMTAMAFLHFKRSGVDVAVLEVGLGGRLDATNVVEPLVSVITSIGLDHCQQLGFTLPEVAREKAGIIKPGRPVVLGRMAPEAREAIVAIARERGSPLVTVEERFGADSAQWPATVLAGEHQRANAATASLVFEAIGDQLSVPVEAVGEGLARVEWAGRWQTRSFGGKQLIFEAAHNPQGAEALGRQLSKLVEETGERPLVAVGALGEARAEALLAEIARYARAIYLFEPNQARATPAVTLRNAIPSSFRGLVESRQVHEAFSPGQCRLGEVGDTLIITGSLYLIGEVLERLEEPLPVREGTLQD
jgi:dihydrofolate synthase/folylpolyglutamate synthase